MILRAFLFIRMLPAHYLVRLIYLILGQVLLVKMMSDFKMYSAAISLRPSGTQRCPKVLIILLVTILATKVII